jgi:hypothetical protein
MIIAAESYCGPEVLFEDIASDLSELRFGTVTTQVLSADGR